MDEVRSIGRGPQSTTEARSMGLGEHLAQLLGGLSPPEPLDVSLSAALGARLGADVVAPRPVPHFPVCARAGYAIRSADAAAGVGLTVVDEVAPGYASSQPVYAGVCVAVQPGAMLPKGADSIVDPARARRNGDQVTLAGPVAAGSGVTAAGALVRQGSVLAASGSVVDPGTIGLLAAAGLARVPVLPRPRVVVVTVGNGLIGAAGPTTDGLLFDSAGPMLAAAAAQSGALATHVGPVAAEDRPLRDAIEDQLIRSDLIVVSGGGEPGEPGVRSYLSALGTVSYDEGSTSLGPFGHGTVGEDRVPILALPADPVRAVMLFHVVAAPMVRAMRGAGPVRPSTVVLAAGVARTGVTTLLLARADTDGRAEPSGPDATVVDYAAADMIVRILPGSGETPAGSRVPAIPLRSDEGDGR